MATCGGWMIGQSVSTPSSPRLVTVIVAEEISVLRSRPRRTRATRSCSSCITAVRGLQSASAIAVETQ